jgi:hypothetical protein
MLRLYEAKSTTYTTCYKNTKGADMNTHKRIIAILLFTFFPSNNNANADCPVPPISPVALPANFVSQWQDAGDFYCSEFTGLKYIICEIFIGSLLSHATAAACQTAKERCDLRCGLEYEGQTCQAPCMADCATNTASCLAGL